MTLEELIRKASESYPDNKIWEAYQLWLERTPEILKELGDTLALFIVLELQDTFDATATDEAQLEEARRCLTTARDEIDTVINALE